MQQKYKLEWWMKTMCQHYVRSSSHVSRLPQWFDTDIYWSYFAPLLIPINLDTSSVCNLWTGNKMVRRRRFPAAGELYCSMKPFQISINLIDILVSNLEITTNVFLLKTSKEPKNLGIFWTRGHGGSCQQSRNRGGWTLDNFTICLLQTSNFNSVGEYISGDSWILQYQYIWWNVEICIRFTFVM